jgi:hypothetical protein
MSNFYAENRSKEFFELFQAEKAITKQLTAERDEYKACKQQWFDKHTALVDELSIAILGEKGEWVDLLNSILEKHK